MNTKVVVTPVIAPHLGRGSSLLQDPRKRREQVRGKIKKKEQEEQEARRVLLIARCERQKRHENITTLIASLLGQGEYRAAQESTHNEINHLLGEFKTLPEQQDRLWVARKVLAITSWRGMRMFDDVEASIREAWNGDIPEEITETLARLMSKQMEFLRKEAKKNGIMRPGKTAADHARGASKLYSE